jgi:hypothetical protein
VGSVLVEVLTVTWAVSVIDVRTASEYEYPSTLLRELRDSIELDLDLVSLVLSGGVGRGFVIAPLALGPYWFVPSLVDVEAYRPLS